MWNPGNYIDLQVSDHLSASFGARCRSIGFLIVSWQRDSLFYGCKAKCVMQQCCTAQHASPIADAERQRNIPRHTSSLRPVIWSTPWAADFVKVADCIGQPCGCCCVCVGINVSVGAPWEGVGLPTAVGHATGGKCRSAIASEGLSLVGVPGSAALLAFGGYNGKYHNSLHIFRPGHPLCTLRAPYALCITRDHIKCHNRFNRSKSKSQRYH